MLVHCFPDKCRLVREKSTYWCCWFSCGDQSFGGLQNIIICYLKYKVLFFIKLFISRFFIAVFFSLFLVKRLFCSFFYVLSAVMAAGTVFYLQSWIEIVGTIGTISALVGSHFLISRPCCWSSIMLLLSLTPHAYASQWQPYCHSCRNLCVICSWPQPSAVITIFLACATLSLAYYWYPCVSRLLAHSNSNCDIAITTADPLVVKVLIVVKIVACKVERESGVEAFSICLSKSRSAPHLYRS